MGRLIILAIMVAALGSAEAATYYVDSDDGHDDATWNGGPGEPWRTITYALSRVSGENTFMCRGTFEEDVPVTDDDRGSEFVGNPAAILNGDVDGSFSTTYTFEGFEIFGCMRGDAITWFSAEDCYFKNPDGGALAPHRYNGAARASHCSIEDCATVCAVGVWEFGRLTLSDCEVRYCGSGVWVIGEVTTSLTRCKFFNVDGTVFSGHFYGEGATFDYCEFYDCGTAIDLSGGLTHGYWGNIEDSTFRGNAEVITVEKDGDWGTVDISGNFIIENEGTALTLGGKNVELRANVVKDNGGHGVYIAEYNADLGTPGDPGGNAFAGNKSGYDVYNASPENIPAYGNAWDPQSEQEMEGKTWQEVNVTRIYDHWDDPNVGYVMWSEPMLGVAPASLGRIKASFKGAPTSGQAGPASKAVGR